MNIDVSFSEIGVIQVELEEALPPTFEVTFDPDFPIIIELGTPGPQGIQGIQGIPGPPGDITTSSIGALADVELSNLQPGDTIVYSSAKFRNYPIENITDGGNF